MPTLWPHQLHGPPSAPPLVLLHGFMGSAHDWAGVIPALAQDLRCIVPDLPGHGQGLPPRPQMGFDTLTSGLTDLLDDLGIEQATVLGYSMGGRLALFAATRIPSRIAALILEGSSPGLRDPQKRRDRLALDRQRADQIRRDGLPAFLDGWYKMPLFATLRARADLYAPMLARRLAANPAHMATAIEALSPGQQPHVWSDLQSLSMPLMLIAGQLDGRYRPLSAQLAALAPDARTRIVLGAGHNVHLEAPGAFVEAVQSFLNSKVTA